MEFLLALIAFAFVLGLLVTIHEFGHFYFAKKAGILCSEFSIGMGPVIYKVKKGETYYSIRALPIGGFVSMAGENMNELLLNIDQQVSIQLENNLITEIIVDPKIQGMVSGSVVSYDLYGKDSKELYLELRVNGEINKYLIAEECYYILSGNNKVPVAPYERCFESKSIMQRFLSIVAGPVMNLILALFIFIICGLALGVPTNDNVIGTVSTNTAQKYLLENDEILQIGEYTIENWEDVGEAMSILKPLVDDTIKMVVLRDGVEKEVFIQSTIQINNIGLTNIGAEENKYGSGVVIGSMAPGNKAASVLEEQDVLLAIAVANNDDFIFHDVNSWKEIIDILEPNNFKYVQLKYAREEDGKYRVETSKKIEAFTDYTLNKMEIEKYSYTIGISPTTQFSFFGGIQNGFELTWRNATLIFSTLQMLINPVSQITVSDLSGPVGIFGLVQSYLTTDFVTFLSLIGMLSVNLFIVNLLPLPALDGGRLVFLAYEAITKKPIEKNVENMVNTIGFVVLMILMLYITFNDFLRL